MKLHQGFVNRCSLKNLVALGIALLLFAGVNRTAAGAVWPTQGWQTATPDESGMDSVLLAQARDYAINQGGGSGFITRGGKLVMAWGKPKHPYQIRSTTKSIGATILGLAIQDAKVSLTDKALDLYTSFGSRPKTNTSTGWLDDITLEQLATHSAGFEKPGGFIDLVFQPGTMWSYSDGGANWLADLLTILYRQDLKVLLFDRVLTKLGVNGTDLKWRKNAYRNPSIERIPRREFGSGIEANVDTLARIGYLYLRGGQWETEQIIPQSFVDAARSPVPNLPELPVNDADRFPNASQHYGLLWWNNADGSLPKVPRDAYWAWGLDDSLIVVIPSLDVVVSRAGSGWRDGWDANYGVLAPFFDPIVQSVGDMASRNAAPPGSIKNALLPSPIFVSKRLEPHLPHLPFRPGR